MFIKKSITEFNALTAEDQTVYLEAKSVNESEMNLKMIGDLKATQEKNAAL